MATPRSYNLSEVAERMLHGDCRALQIGDSTATNLGANRWGGSWIRKLNCDRWVGIRVHAGPTGNPGNGGFPFMGWGAHYPSTGDASDGATAVLFPGGVHSQGLITPTFGQQINRSVLSDLTYFRKGDWTLNQTLTARYVYQNLAGSNLDAVNFQTWVQYDDFSYGLNNVAKTLAGAGAGAQYVEQVFPALTHETDRREAYIVSTATPPNVYYHSAGMWFYRSGVTGFSYDWIAEAGWTFTDHLDPSVDADGKYTDDQLDNHFATSPAVPNTIIITVGLNDGDVVKSEVEAVIARYRTRMYANGITDPLFLLIAPWTVQGDQTNADQRSDVFYEISQEQDDVGFLNLNLLVTEAYGAYASWEETLLSDGTHQSTLGVLAFGELVNEELEDAADDAGWHYSDLQSVIDIIGEPNLRIISNVGTSTAAVDEDAVQRAGELADAYMDARFTEMGWEAPLEGTTDATDTLVRYANSLLTIYFLNQKRDLVSASGQTTPAKIVAVIEQYKRQAEDILMKISLGLLPITATRLKARMSPAGVVGATSSTSSCCYPPTLRGVVLR
jgi:hypothetical protein